MKNNKKGIVGFEDYDYECFTDNIFEGISSMWGLHDYHRSSNRYWLDKDSVISNGYAIGSDVSFASAISSRMKDHAELLDSAKTVFIHPSASIPRNILTSRYRKVLNPWMADVVVVPDSYLECSSTNFAVFINEEEKSLRAACIFERKMLKNFMNAEIGTKMSQLMEAPVSEWIAMFKRQGDSDAVINKWIATFNSELEFIGPAYRVIASNEWFFDMLDGSIPKDRVVFEKTALMHMGNEGNKITFENLMNIRDMLKSNDSDNQGVALKALSMLDYIHYPCSVLFTLDNTRSSWNYCSGADASSVKFMFQQLIGGTARSWMTIRNESISQEDYDLFLKLVPALMNSASDGEIRKYIAGMPFMYTDDTFSVHPRIIKSV